MGFSFADQVLIGLCAVAGALFFRNRWYRLRSAPPRPAPAAPAIEAVFFIALLLLGPFGLGLSRFLFGIDIADGGLAALPLADQVRLSIGSYGAQLVAALLWWIVALRCETRASARQWGWGKSAAAGAGSLLLFWPAVVTTTVAVAFIGRMLGGEGPPRIAHATLRALRESEIDVWFVTMSALVIAVVPIIEEVMYRGLLQDAMVRLSVPRWGAIVATSLVFALMHAGGVKSYALPGLFVLSLGFGWIYERTGRLAAPIVMHMLFNAGNLGLAFVLEG